MKYEYVLTDFSFIKLQPTVLLTDVDRQRKNFTRNVRKYAVVMLTGIQVCALKFMILSLYDIRGMELMQTHP